MDRLQIDTLGADTHTFTISCIVSSTCKQKKTEKKLNCPKKIDEGCEENHFSAKKDKHLKASIKKKKINFVSKDLKI